MELRDWEQVDVILFSGDAYIDHPAFGAAVIGRTLEAAGYRVAIVPQPDWHGDYRDFKKLGRPRLFFAISAGSMDSMVNHYTANRRLRSDDAYSPDGRAGLRPDYCTDVYTHILKQLYPDVPVVIGGIEASMRRLAHYDYWSDQMRPSILQTSGADVLIYGMGEKPILRVAQELSENGREAQWADIHQIAYSSSKRPTVKHIALHSFEEEKKDKRIYADDFRIYEEQVNCAHADIVAQPSAEQWIIVNPPYPTMTTEETDASFDLPYQMRPHPKYKGKTIPAYDMIRFSVCLHRGCFGGCAFCTIAAHQGKHIASRSKKSILKEIEKISALPDFKGYLSDLGGPSANMYKIAGADPTLCERCRRASCIYPARCKNLHVDFAPLMDIYKTVDHLPYIKKAFVGSGIRYDLLTDELAEEIITNHVSGRLKVAPEHTESHVLALMRKPEFSYFQKFQSFFERINQSKHLNQQLIPYFISSHPGCRLEDMAELAIKTKKMNFHLEQVQDFTPTPMTLATCMFYTGLNPYTMEPIFVARSKQDKLEQRQFFFYYKSEYQATIRKALQRIKRPDLIKRLFNHTVQWP